MLELRNIGKTYATKKGVSVKALDNVSVVFGKTGLVFVTGKSGSGKSTLLNLIGGLDTYDTGDMIINQKSSQDFKQKDFDSYRNTMVGFIFQEYNILEEFSVAQNIGLALALQGQKVSDEAVNDLLKKLDIEGLGNRSPNELSGGQKQRVAIARALVKNPQIILADEPTGALDSNTGIQLLETLKSLSKDRLVIVISHDLEFARKYADRIVHFVDGKIAYDITYTGEESQSDEPVKFTDKGITIEPKYQLTAEDLKVINAYLQNQTKPTHIKKISDQTYSGFSTTDTSDIEQSSEPFKLVKSKLPFKASLSMSLNALIHKKIRLVFTILLTTISLVMFGSVDTLSNFNAEDKSYEVFEKNNYNYLMLKNYKRGGDSSWYYYTEVNLDEEVFQSASDLYSNSILIPVYPLSLSLDAYIKYDWNKPSFYDAYYYTSFIEIDNETLLGTNFEVTGRLPQNLNEVVVPMHFYQSVAYYGFNKEDSVKDINEMDDLIGEMLYFNERNMKIVGIIDYKDDLSVYEELKVSGWNQGVDTPQNYYKYVNRLREGTLGLFIFGEGYYESLRHVKNSRVEAVFYLENERMHQFSTVSKITDVDAETIKYFDSVDPLNLGENDIVINEYHLGNMIHRDLGDYQYNTIIVDFLVETYYDELNLLLAEHFPMYETVDDIPDEDRIAIIGYELYGYISDAERYTKAFNAVVEFYLSTSEAPSFQVDFFKDYYTNYPIIGLRVVGFTSDEDNVYAYHVSNELYDELYIEGEIIYNFILVSTKDMKREDFNKMVQQSMNKGLLYKVSLQDENIDYMIMLSETVYGMQQFFFWTAVILAGFAALLMFTFISSSVSHSKQEIGILRAIGASSRDVLGIFSKETLMISIMNAVLGVIGTVIITKLLNDSMIYNLNLGTTLFDVGIRQIILVTLISIVIGYLSSALPVLKTASKKPIDAIKNK
ncbi:ABC transporter ATP-binding protein/permease [Acholeplasma laidlawii]|uniref:ABC transporter ATP-binding protein/permease n=1 Tax=Acholeplasma laidlawii TaxID=2148 RepID=UPI000C1923D6|nr:ABC transporter ATP-binding protein/permease [Acholeplasma laidlawii]PII03903.1 hypothetical protein B9P96_002230 [Acholeplasma laidlawii]